MMHFNTFKLSIFKYYVNFFSGKRDVFASSTFKQISFKRVAKAHPTTNLQSSSV